RIKILQFLSREPAAIVVRHERTGGDGQLLDVQHGDEMQIAFAVQHLQRVIVPIASQALNLLSVLEPDGYAFLARHLETLERPDDRLLDERERTGGADIGQVGSHASTVAPDG